MPTQTINLLPLATRPAGSRSFGPANVPVGVTEVSLSMDCTQFLSPTLFITWSLELSQDDGANWLPWGSAGCPGGPLFERDGVTPLTRWSFRVPLPNPTNSLRRARGSVVANEETTTDTEIALFSP